MNNLNKFVGYKSHRGNVLDLFSQASKVGQSKECYTILHNILHLSLHSYSSKGKIANEKEK